MSQCVPNWDLDDPPSHAHGIPLNPSTTTTTTTTHGPRSNYEVAELTWVNGHPSMHGLGQFRIGKPIPKYPSPGSWDKALTSGGTLESVVDQATGAILFPTVSQSPPAADYDLAPWITAYHRRGGSAATNSDAAAAAGVMDALVPCSNRPLLVDDHSTRVPEKVVGIGSCGGRERARAAGEGNCSVSGSAASLGLPLDTCDINGGDDVGFTTSTSPLDGSPDTENTSCGREVTIIDEHDSASHSRRFQRDGVREGEEKRKGDEVVRSSISTKRSRAAAVHNQSERKRRDRINQRMKTLQKLVPNSSKTDKASMLDEVIDYLKQLQAQVQMMSRMSSIPHMMMPMPMQQIQMAMMAQMAQMAQMGMGMGMAMGMDMNPLAARPPAAPATIPAIPPQPVLHPSAFLPFAGSSWDGTGDRGLPAASTAGTLLPTDPFSAFMACQAQPMQKPMNMDAFSRMAAMCQQLYQQQQQQAPQPNPNLNPNPQK